MTKVYLEKEHNLLVPGDNALIVRNEPNPSHARQGSNLPSNLQSSSLFQTTCWAAFVAVVSPNETTY